MITRKKQGPFWRAFRRWTHWFLEWRNPGGMWVSATNRTYENFDKSRGVRIASSAAMCLCRRLVETDGHALTTTVKGFEINGVVQGDFRVTVERLQPKK